MDFRDNLKDKILDKRRIFPPSYKDNSQYLYQYKTITKEVYPTTCTIPYWPFVSEISPNFTQRT
ncbi:hypothetical protein Vi05172_g4229 [Venturia inaequalis]|nr:hypothetical protein Vi05172_g4229 [Venturia inaequalis]